MEAAVGGDPGMRAGELAHHWSKAVVAVNSGKVARYAQLAGDRALDQLAPDEALRWYTQALAHLDADAPDARHRIEMLIGLGDAQRQVGIADYRENLLEAARLADETDAVDLLVKSVLANNRGMLSNNIGVDVARVALIDRALERINDDQVAERARLLALACLERIYGGTFEERFALAERAVAAAHACGDPNVLVTTMTYCADGIFVPHTAGLRRSWIAEAEPLAAVLTEPTARYLLHNWTRFSAIEWADATTVRTSDGLAKRAIARGPQATLQWNNAFHQVWQETLWGS